MARGIIIKNVEDAVLPLSLVESGTRDVQIILCKRVAIVRDEDLVEATKALFGVKVTNVRSRSKKKTTKKKRTP